MIYAEKLRERTLGGNFRPEEIAGLLGVSTNESLKIFKNLYRDCFVVEATNGKYKVIVGDKRDELIKTRLEACEKQIQDTYTFFTHLKSLVNEHKGEV